MAFDFNRQPLRLYSLFPESPFPVEVSIYGFCRMACDFCSHVDTPIMLDDLTTKKAGDVKEGDVLLGWERGKKFEQNRRAMIGAMKMRTWAKSTVLKVFHRKTPVVRLELANGETIICTPDHPWFTGRTGVYEFMPPSTEKWRSLKRLEVSLVESKPFSSDYMIGYIRGIMEGDGTWMPQGTWRLAMTDMEPLDRVISFLAKLGFGIHEKRDFNGNRSAGWTEPEYMKEIVFPVGSPVNDLINGFDIDSKDYIHGWLGGIYDAEGNTPGGRLNNAFRIAQYPNINPLTFQRIERALRICNFGYVGEDKGVRLYGGRIEMCRFVQLARPCIESKKNPLLDGGIKGMIHDQQIMSITPIGEADVASFETSTHNYIAGGCMSRNCFANLGRLANDRELNLDNSAPALFRKLDRVIEDEHDPIGWFLRERYPVVFSNTTDPFQRDEKTYRASEAFLSWCKARKIPVSIQTRGNVLYEDFARYIPLITPGRCVVYLSICQSDDKDRKRHEPGAISIEKRWELAHKLSDHGIPVVAACVPYAPAWVPDPALYVQRAKEAGCRGVTVDNLHLSPKQSEETPKVFREELLRNSNLAVHYLLPLLNQWKEACHVHGLTMDATTQWNALIGEPYKFVEAANPDWLGGKIFNPTHRILDALSSLSRENSDRQILIGWGEIEAAFRAMEIPNPTLNTQEFWYAYNYTVCSDYRPWKQTLGKQASLWEILRYFWNHPYEACNFMWHDWYMRPIWDPTTKLLCLDDDGNAVGLYDRKRSEANARRDFDHQLVQWDSALWPQFN